MRTIIAAALALTVTACESYREVDLAICDGYDVGCPTGTHPECGDGGAGYIGDCAPQYTRPLCDDGSPVWCEPDVSQ